MFADVAQRLALGRSVSKAAYQIFQYSFTEMLNNAIVAA